jgi:hypothetical protein
VFADAVAVRVGKRRRLELRLRRDDVAERRDGRGLVRVQARRQQIRNGDGGDDGDDRDHDHQFDQREADLPG